MKTDALARRIRFAAPAPKLGENIIPQEADLVQWEAISRHGPLPITYLAKFGGRKNFNALQHRLRRLFDLKYLTRPGRQFETMNSHCAFIVYDLTPKALAMLNERACSMPPSRSAPFVHQLMQACFTASLELAKGDRFLPRDRVITADSLAIQLSQSRIIPDDVFAIRTPEGNKRFYLLEIDRNTESIERTTVGYNTWKKKVADYDELLNGALRKAWGIPVATVLVVTTNAQHAKNIERYVKANSSHADRWRFLVEPTFGLNWRVPEGLLKSVEEL